MKKLVILPALALAFVASAMSASAWYQPSFTLVDNYNQATAHNNLFAKSNTGKNFIFSADASHATIETGNAIAGNLAETNANFTTIEVSPPMFGKTIIKNGNTSHIENNLTSIANSGFNKIGADVMMTSPLNLNENENGYIHQDLKINSGDAMSSNEAFTMVNSSTIRIH